MVSTTWFGCPSSMYALFFWTLTFLAGTGTGAAPGMSGFPGFLSPSLAPSKPLVSLVLGVLDGRSHILMVLGVVFSMVTSSGSSQASRHPYPQTYPYPHGTLVSSAYPQALPPVSGSLPRDLRSLIDGCSHPAYPATVLVLTGAVPLTPVVPVLPPYPLTPQVLP